MSAQSSVLIDGLTGQVLYEHNAYQTRAMASTTKIMTALLAIESGDLSREVVATKEMVTVEGSSMGLMVGDTVSLEALCYGMLMASGNDAAHMTAMVLAQTEEAFSEKMNARAVEIGMKNTHFVTASGLDAKDHYSTAYDMALLGREAMKNPLFAAMVRRTSARVCFGNPPYERTISGHNKLLGMYEWACGIKTGFTKKAGRCLVSAARKDGALLIAVTLSAPDDWNDHIKLYNYGFEQMESVALEPDDPDLSVPVTGGEDQKVPVLWAQTVVALPKSRQGSVSSEVELEYFVYAPVSFGQVVGEVIYRWEGHEIARSPLIAGADVAVAPPKPPTVWEKIGNWFQNLLTKE